MKRLAWGVLPLSALASAARAGDELSVLILDDGGSATADLLTALEGAGHSVLLSSDADSYEYDFDGTVDGESVLAFDSVIWLDGSGAQSVDMDPGG